MTRGRDFCEEHYYLFVWTFDLDIHFEHFKDKCLIPQLKVSLQGTTTTIIEMKLNYKHTSSGTQRCPGYLKLLPPFTRN